MLYNLSVIEVLGDNDPDFIKSLLNIFVESIPPDLEVLNNAHQEKDWNKVAFIAHKMKSTIDNLCVDSLTSVIRALEDKNFHHHLEEEKIDQYILLVNEVMNNVIIQMHKDFPDL